MIERNAKIYVAGHTGLTGSSVVRKLKEKGFTNLLLKTRAELNLFDPVATKTFFEKEKPEYVVVCAARVGGIIANSTYPADFLVENLTIQHNIIWNAHLVKVRKLIFLGSSCIYPRLAPQPMKEEYMLTGPFEPTNDAYAVAKIAGITLCQKLYSQYGDKFISCIPTNLYGPNDNFSPEAGHVIPGLMERMHSAKVKNDPTFPVWGTGNVKREFLYVDDFADAIFFLLEDYDKPEFLNIGTGDDLMIRELAEKLQKVIGYKGQLVFDTSKPDGMPRKWLDVSKLHALGWKHSISLDDGLQMTYDWYVKHAAASI